MINPSIFNPRSSTVPSGHQDSLDWILQVQQGGQIVAEVAREQEMLADKLVTDPSHALALVGVAQQVANPVSGAFGGMDQKAGVIIVDLQGDAAAGAADHRFPLPQSLRHRQPESFFDRLLQNDQSRALQSVDDSV